MATTLKISGGHKNFRGDSEALNSLEMHLPQFQQDGRFWPKNDQTIPLITRLTNLTFLLFHESLKIFLLVSAAITITF